MYWSSFWTSCSCCWLISGSCTRDVLTLQQDGFDRIAGIWYILVALHKSILVIGLPDLGLPLVAGAQAKTETHGVHKVVITGAMFQQFASELEQDPASIFVFQTMRP